jgi:hypothetical protein
MLKKEVGGVEWTKSRLETADCEERLRTRRMEILMAGSDGTDGYYEEEARDIAWSESLEDIMDQDGEHLAETDPDLCEWYDAHDSGTGDIYVWSNRVIPVLIFESEGEGEYRVSARFGWNYESLGEWEDLDLAMTSAAQTLPLYAEQVHQSVGRSLHDFGIDREVYDFIGAHLALGKVPSDPDRLYEWASDIKKSNPGIDWREAVLETFRL